MSWSASARTIAIAPSPDRMRGLAATFLCLLAFILSSCIVRPKKQPGDIVLRYPFANDSILIRLNNCAISAEANDTIHFVYFSDGSLKSGKKMEEMIGKYKSGLLKRNYVFVGLGHFGSYRSKRRRDFIMPSIQASNPSNESDPDYGRADSFIIF